MQGFQKRSQQAASDDLIGGCARKGVVRQNQKTRACSGRLNKGR